MKKILMWVLTAFMALTAIAYFPSISSVISIMFALIAAPIVSWQEFLSSKGLRGFGKGLVLAAAFLAVVITAPTQGVSSNTPSMDRPTASPAAVTAAPKTTPEPETTPEPTPTPAPTPTPEPTPEPTPAPESVPVQSQDESSSNGGGGGGNGDGSNFNAWDNPEQQQTSSSWVLNTNSKKIHYPSCSSVSKIAPKNYSTSNSSLSDLLSRGYTRCGRCF